MKPYTTMESILAVFNTRIGSHNGYDQPVIDTPIVTTSVVCKFAAQKMIEAKKNYCFIKENKKQIHYLGVLALAECIDKDMLPVTECSLNSLTQYLTSYKRSYMGLVLSDYPYVIIDHGDKGVDRETRLPIEHSKLELLEFTEANLNNPYFHGLARNLVLLLEYVMRDTIVAIWSGLTVDNIKQILESSLEEDHKRRSLKILNRDLVETIDTLYLIDAGKILYTMKVLPAETYSLFEEVCKLRNAIFHPKQQKIPPLRRGVKIAYAFTKYLLPDLGKQQVDARRTDLY